MEPTGVIIPLNEVTIVAILEQKEARKVYNFLKEKLEINEQVVKNLVNPIKKGSFWESFLDLTNEMKIPLKGFFDNQIVAPSFVGVVSAERVLRAAIAWMKLDITVGKTSILNGNKKLSEESIRFFLEEKSHDWELEDPTQCSLLELELGMRFSQKKMKEQNLGTIEDNMESSLERMAKIVIREMDENGLLKEKCQICRKSIHSAINGSQELNCPLYKPYEVCLKCGSLAQKGCFGGIKGASCRETKLCHSEECKNFPVHSPKIHEMSGVVQSKIKAFYGQSFRIREKRANTEEHVWPNKLQSTIRGSHNGRGGNPRGMSGQGYRGAQRGGRGGTTGASGWGGNTGGRGGNEGPPNRGGASGPGFRGGSGYHNWGGRY